MKPLEATVEIVKSVLGEEKNSSYLLNSEEHRGEFLKGIAALYEKLTQLEKQNAE
ncbi:MAG: hypothetical protein WD098_00215 [Balneolales bacterium]